MGANALTLPFVVSFVSSKPLSSISVSYYSEARNGIVGMLFVVGSFLLAYNGYSVPESVASKIASCAAILIALCPTNCDMCPVSAVSVVHYCSSTTLFSILAYFCLGPFSKKANERHTRKAGRRRIVYLVCGVIMIGCILTVAVSGAVLPAAEVRALRITYWAEAVALVAFGISWMTASKAFAVFADKDEMIRFFTKSHESGKRGV
jgi:quinol-cytochrome oxidoreductase complex cytochrome b subunit